ncbi:hypothetical protein CDES_01455 [Corynebacterium deserti GIMN1.010]|uniref:Phage infection protein n=1 Tax=Corynebacterium deserti GIMN1.010 TaxID=931089 RepID=A0A0M4CE40_9CORY|nr:hypothetical protein [Corynebacterium deserti]ALC04765.1 hypothetical protein CDES_01455 [Corynebacterium deserti GIMN1.010]
MSAASPSRKILTALFLFVPLIAGTIYAAAMNLDVSRAWSSAEEVTGAPAASVATNNEELINARRAAGEAGAQAGFLVSGTEELTNGTQQLIDGAKPLEDGVSAAATGAQQLHDGLIQLQAGTGQLGAGATEIADGVQGAVEQIGGLVIVQQQLLGALDEADRRLAESNAPEAADLRNQITEVRNHLNNFGISVETTDQLDRLRSGTRDLANQLNVPGYGFHDGIYSATNGAAELAAGLQELESGVDDAVAGFTALDQGANQIDSMATLNKQKTDAVQRALPVPQVPAGTVASTGAAAEEERTTALAPMYAFLISALVMLAGAALGWASIKNNWLLAFVLLGVTVIGGIILFTVALGMSFGALLGALGVLLLATLVAGIITRVLLNLIGTTGAIVVSVIGWIAQAAVIGHVWSVTTVSDIALVWRVIAGLMPLHYPTFAVTSIGNAGSQAAIWMSVAVLLAMGSIGAFALRKPAVAEVEVVDEDVVEKLTSSWK